jgi:SAM-dependent methyltransferase
MDVNSLQIKQILSLIRDGDFAHAGEKEAMDIVFNAIMKDSSRLMLDVGCGLGGSANYLQKNGWGKIIGIDINAKTIEYAKKNYPQIELHTTNVINVTKYINRQIDLIYLLNVFYVLPNQAKALTELRKIIKNGEKLIIFDYVDLGEYNNNRPPQKYNILPQPINMQKIEQLLLTTGWKINNIKNLNQEYECWYEEFVGRIRKKQHEIIKNYGKKTYDYIYNTYFSLLTAIKDGYLGGTTIYSEAI